MAEVSKGEITLVSSDGEQITVPKKVAQMSVLVKEMTDEEDDDDSGPQSIPLPNVKAAILHKVIEFCKHHENEPMQEIDKPLRSQNMHEVVSDWDAKFVEI